MDDWRKLPVLKDNRLLFVDTTGYPLPGRIVPCLLCTKPFIMRPFTGEPDQICEECSKVYHDCAVVRCSGCKHHPVICRVLPKVMDNGYVIRPMAVLHTDACNVCKPGLRESTITEINRWERTIRKGKPIIVVPGR